MNRLPGRLHVQRSVSSFYDFLEASNRRTLTIERLLSANIISLEEARQRLGILSSEWTAPMQTVHLVPPEPPAGPPRYTLLGGSRTEWTAPTGDTGFTGSLSISQPLSERLFGRPMPTDLSFGPGYYPDEPFMRVATLWPWWVTWQLFWILVSIGVIGLMLSRGIVKQKRSFDL